ncbi:MAG: response regulator [Hyphomicrobium sp.]
MQSNTPRILVADDDLGVIAAYRHVLEREQHATVAGRRRAADALDEELFGTAPQKAEDTDWRVHFVDQGRDAVDAVRESMDKQDPFRIAFLDIQMPPGMDGYATARAMRRLDPNLDIVIVSGYSDYTPEELTEVAGPADKLHFLPKPVWPDQLQAIALWLCDARRERMESAKRP